MWKVMAQSPWKLSIAHCTKAETCKGYSQAKHACLVSQTACQGYNLQRLWSRHAFNSLLTKRPAKATVQAWARIFFLQQGCKGYKNIPVATAQPSIQSFGWKRLATNYSLHRLLSSHQKACEGCSLHRLEPSHTQLAKAAAIGALIFWIQIWRKLLG